MLAPVLVFAGLLVYLNWRRIGQQQAAWLAESPAISPNLVLIALPTAFASALANRTVGILVTAAVALMIFWKRPGTSFKLTWPCAVLPAVGCTIAFRLNPPASMLTAAFFVLGCILVLQAVSLSASKASAVASLVDGIGVFLVLSMALWTVGFRANTGRTDGLENLLTGGERVIFPLSNSLFLTSAMAAVYVASAVPLIMLYHKFRLARLTAVACALSIFVLSDTRAAMLAGLFVSGFALVAPRLLQRGGPFLVAGSLLLPFIYQDVRRAIAAVLNFATSFAPWAARANEDASTLNYRDFIWARSLDFFLNRADWFHQATGYGAFGHTASGASSSYSRGLAGLGSDTRLITPHNTILQVLFDGGWVTASALAVTMVATAFILARGGPVVSLSGLTMLVALALVSITEVALSPSHAQPTWWVLVALTAIAWGRDDSPIAGPGAPVADQHGVPGQVSERLDSE